MDRCCEDSCSGCWASRFPSSSCCGCSSTRTPRPGPDTPDPTPQTRRRRVFSCRRALSCRRTAVPARDWGAPVFADRRVRAREGMAGWRIVLSRTEASGRAGRTARGGKADDEQQRRERCSAGAERRDGRPAGGTVVGEAGRTVVADVFRIREHAEHGGEDAQAQRQEHGVSGAVVHAGRFVEAGEVGKRGPQSGQPASIASAISVAADRATKRRAMASAR